MKLFLIACALVLCWPLVASAQRCPGGVCPVPSGGVSVQIGVPVAPVVPVTPPTIYQPRVEWEPWDYRGSYFSVRPRLWQGPIWTAFAGRYRWGVGHYYAPRR